MTHEQWLQFFGLMSLAIRQPGGTILAAAKASSMEGVLDEFQALVEDAHYPRGGSTEEDEQ
jgi:hypothetical protein